jgi:prepilin-type N-terminal cleavage/methylation domain-containing protein
MRLSHLTVRRGFTLVELMVAVTLVIFIMVILTEAFKSGIDSFRNLRAAGELAERLRSAGTVIRNDLAAPHFESNGLNAHKNEFLRDQRLDLPKWQPPDRGYFRIWQGSQSTPENSDSEGISFSRATDHALVFTSAFEADEPGAYATGRVPVLHTALNANNQDKIWHVNNQDLSAFSGNYSGVPTDPYRYASRWAEIALFLRATGSNTTDTNGGAGIPLYSLHRRVRVIPRTPTNPSPQFEIDTSIANVSNYERDYDMSVSPNQVSTNYAPPSMSTPAKYLFNNLAMLTDWRVRMDCNYVSTTSGANARAGGLFLWGGQFRNGPRAIVDLSRPSTTDGGDDILLNDVISFEVKAWYRALPGLTPAISDSPTVGGTDTPFADLPLPSFGRNQYFRNSAARIFDTGMNPKITDDAIDLNATGWKMDWETATDNAAAQRFGYLTTDPRAANFVPPLRIHIKALQIKIRVWDVKTRTTRQVTIVQEV